MKSLLLSCDIFTVVVLLSIPAFTCAQATQAERSSAAAQEGQSVADKSDKKKVQQATLHLQTTITGNQEQPRVLYILPWQSPGTAEVDLEALDSEQKAVFNHVEREELRRELQSLEE